MKTSTFTITILVYCVEVFCSEGNITESVVDYTASAREVKEIQHTTCKISTEQIRASANATTIRQLHGVCTSIEMNERMGMLEKKLLNELNKITDMLRGLLLQNPNNSYVTKQFPIVKSLLEKDHPPPVQNYAAQENRNNHLQIENTNRIPKSPNARESEMIKYNSTIQTTELGASFLYYWKIFDIEDIFKSTENYIECPIYPFAHPLYIKLYPKHKGSQYLALELEDGVNSIHKGYYKFVILNQRSAQYDLSSQLLGPEASIYRISFKKITHDFVKDGSLVVKVLIAL